MASRVDLDKVRDRWSSVVADNRFWDDGLRMGTDLELSKLIQDVPDLLHEVQHLRMVAGVGDRSMTVLVGSIRGGGPRPWMWSKGKWSRIESAKVDYSNAVDPSVMRAVLKLPTDDRTVTVEWTDREGTTRSVRYTDAEWGVRERPHTWTIYVAGKPG